MAKHKYKNKSKNKNNNSPAVAPKAKFSTPENDVEKTKAEVKKAPENKKNTKKTKSEKKPCAFCQKIKKHKKLVWASAVFAVIVAVVIILIVTFSSGVPELAVSEYNGQNATASVAADITVDEETQLERYDEIKRKIKGDKRKFKFYCRPSIEIDEKYNEGTIMFSNLTMNDCTMIVTIMDKEDDIIFRSMGIAPGKCMQRIALTKTLNYGMHEVTMYVTAYDSMTFEVIGTQRMEIELQIGNEYNASDESELLTSETNTTPSVTRPVEATSATRPTNPQVTTPVTKNTTSTVVQGNSTTALNTTKSNVATPNSSTANKVIKTTRNAS